MAEHERLTEKVGIQVYFADPGQPQQQGTNENTNGLIRECFPKKIDLRKYSDEEIFPSGKYFKSETQGSPFLRNS
ncbi:MAG: IS30 family transposase [Chlamydiales bacterium]|jgi:IS30 family transposase